MAMFQNIIVTTALRKALALVESERKQLLTTVNRKTFNMNTIWGWEQVSRLMRLNDVIGDMEEQLDCYESLSCYCGKRPPLVHSRAMTA
jgi:hypothetical protein